MKSIKIISLITFLGIIFYYCSTYKPKEEFKIESFDEKSIHMSKVNPGHFFLDFLVTGYNGNRKQQNVIDSIICHYLNKSKGTSGEQSITFYKKTETCNKEEFIKYPDDYYENENIVDVGKYNHLKYFTKTIAPLEGSDTVKIIDFVCDSIHFVKKY